MPDISSYESETLPQTYLLTGIILDYTELEIVRKIGIFIVLITIGAFALVAGCVSSDEQNATTPAATTAPTTVPTPAEKASVAYIAGNTNSTEIISLEKGTWIFDMSYEGSGYFEVDAMDNMSFVKVYDGNGTFSGRQALGTLESGNYTINVTADAPWKINVLKPEISSQKMPLRFEGTGDNVTEMFYLPAGNTSFAMKSDGDSVFAVWLYDENGNFVFDKTGTYLMPLHAHMGAYNKTVEVQINKPGNYLANILTRDSDSNWSVSIS